MLSSLRLWMVALGLASSMAAVATALDAAAAEGPSWTIYHSWNGGTDYSRRGVLTWKGDEMVVENDENALGKAQLEEMLKTGWYHVKIDTTDNDYVMATVPACHLRRANFKDEWSIVLPRVSRSEKSILSFSYTPLISPLAPKSCEDLPLPEEIQLSSRAQVTLDTPAMTIRPVLPHTKPPPGLKFLVNPNAKKTTKDGKPVNPLLGGGEEGDEPPQSFLRRYWYVLLPLVLGQFLGGPEQPESKEGGPPAEGGAPAVGGAAAPAAAAGGASAAGGGGGAAPAKARRGKKG